MKILHINTFSTGGAATAAIRLHRALLKRGYNSKILFLSGTGSIENGYYWNVQEKVAFKKSFPIRFSEKTERIIQEILPYRFKRRNKVENIRKPNVEIFTSPISDYSIDKHELVKEADLIQLHWVADFLNWRDFFEKIKKPIFWYFHDMNPILGGVHYSDDLKKIQNSYLEKKEILFNQIKVNSLASACNINIQCDSNWLTKETVKSGRFAIAKNIETIHYSLDFDIFYPLEKINLKKYLGVGLDYKVILFGCDNIQNERKGFDLLVEALNLIEDKKNIMLCTFGSGFDLKLLTKGEFLIKNFGKINNLDLQRLIYSVADFFIIPSRQEAFGQTALESLACGTPVIGFNTGGIPDIIEDEVNGLLVKKITAEDLKTKITRLIDDNELLSNLTKASRNSVLTKFSQEKQVKAFVNLYSEQFNNIKKLSENN